MSISRRELLVVLVLTAVGFAVRFAFLDEVAVEHFDEGVYASNLWFPDSGYAYPQRHLYAPPLLPSLIEFSMMAFGDARWAPLLPALLLGALTVPLTWLALRSWAGPAVGAAAASLLALNDFHISLSRSALTDAPLVFFLILAVWLIGKALATLDLRIATAAGIAAGLAWATKYNGWLPIAIAVSGTIAALIFVPRALSNRQDKSNDDAPPSGMDAFIVLATFVVIALATFSPVWWSLQQPPSGVPAATSSEADVGYSAVMRNHRRYVTGFSNWWPAANRHETVQRHYAGWLTLCSGWLAVVTAATLIASERSTWNTDESPARRSTWNDSRFRGTVIIVTGMASGIVYSPLLLLVVWSLIELVSRINAMRTQHETLLGTTWLASWLALAWLVGLVLSTPCYVAYPRLVLPLIVVGQAGTSLAIVRLLTGSLLNAGTTVELDSNDDGPQSRSRVRRYWWVIPVVLLCLLKTSRNPGHGWQKRTELADAAQKALIAAAEDCRGEDSGVQIDFVVYVYGEPGLFFHLPGDSIAVQPVTDLNFALPGSGHAHVPTYVLTGPNSANDASFDEHFAAAEEFLEPVSVFPWRPSDFVLLDNHEPRVLDDHRAALIRLFRVRFGD